MSRVIVLCNRLCKRVRARVGESCSTLDEALQVQMLAVVLLFSHLTFF